MVGGQARVSIRESPHSVHRKFYKKLESLHYFVLVLFMPETLKRGKYMKYRGILLPKGPKRAIPWVVPPKKSAEIRIATLLEWFGHAIIGQTYSLGNSSIFKIYLRDFALARAFSVPNYGLLRFTLSGTETEARGIYLKPAEEWEFPEVEVKKIKRSKQA